MVFVIANILIDDGSKRVKGGVWVWDGTGRTVGGRGPSGEKSEYKRERRLRWQLTGRVKEREEGKEGEDETVVAV